MTDITPFDRRAVRLHRERAAALVGRVAPVLHDAAERLLDRLDDTTRRFTRALDVGGRGAVAPLLRARGVEVVSCDLSPAMARLWSIMAAGTAPPLRKSPSQVPEVPSTLLPEFPAEEK